MPSPTQCGLPHPVRFVVILVAGCPCARGMSRLHGRQEFTVKGKGLSLAPE